MENKKISEMSDAQVRQKLIDGHIAFSHQLSAASADLARVSLSLIDPKKVGQRKKHSLALKANALTALYEKLTMLTAVIDFIETLGVIEGPFDPKVRIKDLLRTRHTQLILNVNRLVPDLMGEINDLAQLVARAIEQGEILHIGEKFRERLGSSHARLMKDLAVIGYLQQYGITYKSTTRRN